MSYVKKAAQRYYADYKSKKAKVQKGDLQEFLSSLSIIQSHNPPPNLIVAACGAMYAEDVMESAGWDPDTSVLELDIKVYAPKDLIWMQLADIYEHQGMGALREVLAPYKSVALRSNSIALETLFMRDEFTDLEAQVKSIHKFLLTKVQTFDDLVHDNKDVHLRLIKGMLQDLGVSFRKDALTVKITKGKTASPDHLIMVNNEELYTTPLLDFWDKNAKKNWMTMSPESEMYYNMGSDSLYFTMGRRFMGWDFLKSDLIKYWAAIHHNDQDTVKNGEKFPKDLVKVFAASTPGNNLNHKDLKAFGRGLTTQIKKLPDYPSKEDFEKMLEVNLPKLLKKAWAKLGLQTSFGPLKYERRITSLALDYLNTFNYMDLNTLTFMGLILIVGHIFAIKTPWNILDWKRALGM
jgi:hypothetical protein